MGEPLTWVVGAGGLLGQHVLSTLTDDARFMSPRTVPWASHDEAEESLCYNARALVRAADAGPWQVIWCAGAGVTGTSAETFAAEERMLSAVLETLAVDDAGRGSFFLASSAGGVYAGSTQPPYDEFSEPSPLSDYGRAKLRAEELVTQWSRRTGIPVLIGRIANLYGPGQNLAKAQGLVSQLCAAQLERRPISIWVSLDTLRDYIFAPDCARLILDAMDRLRREEAARPSGDGLVVTKILATQRAITIGAVIAEIRRLLRRRPTIVLGASPTSSLQGRNLSLVSRVWPEVDEATLTTFPAGINATLADLRLRLQQGKGQGQRNS